MTVFLHERRTPSGQSRLVWASLQAKAGFRGGQISVPIGGHVAENRAVKQMYVMLGLGTRVLGHPTPGAAATKLWSHRLNINQPEDRRWYVENRPRDTSAPVPGPTLRIFAGRADPNDTTHFAIDYALDGKPGTIDAWLGDDDRIRFLPDRGRKEMAMYDSTAGTEQWNPYED